MDLQNAFTAGIKMSNGGTFPYFWIVIIIVVLISGGAYVLLEHILPNRRARRENRERGE